MSSVLPELPRLARYALAAAFELADHPDERLPSGRIADAIEAPPAMLSKVLASLTHAGIIEGVRGHGGGFRLARPPEEVLLVDVIAAATGASTPTRVDCVLGVRRCDSEHPCALHDAWIDVVDAACRVLCEQSLASFR